MDEYSTELPRFPNSRLPSLAAAPGPVTRAWGTGCWIPLSMMLRVSIEEAADHPLILRVVLARFVLEELHAALAQGNRDLDAFLPKHQILGSRQEIGNDLQVSQGFIGVLDFLAHRFAFLSASNPRHGCG